MGNISSPVIKRLNHAIQWTAPKHGKTLKCKRVFRTRNDDLVIECDDNRFIFARLSGPYHKNVMVLASKGHYGMIEALSSMGHIPAEEMKAHKAAIDKHHRDNNIEYDGGRLDEMAKEYGFTLTPKQRQVMKLTAKKKKA